MLLPAIRQKCPANPGGKFGAQGQAVAAAILKRIHFLRHHIGGLAQRPGKHRGRLEHRHLDALESVKSPHALERLDDVAEPFLILAKYVLRAAHRLRCLYLCHAERFSQRSGKAEVAYFHQSLWTKVAKSFIHPR